MSKRNMKTSPEIKSAVESLLEYHKDEIAASPEAAHYARQMKSALKTGQLENPKTRRRLLREGNLCAIHLAFETCLKSLFGLA